MTSWLLHLSELQIVGLLALPFVVCAAIVVVVFLLEERQLRGSALRDTAERRVAYDTRPHGCGVEPLPMRRHPRERR